MKVLKNIRNLIDPLLFHDPQTTDESSSSTDSSSSEVTRPSSLLVNECRRIFGFSRENEIEQALKHTITSLLSIHPQKEWFTLCHLDLHGQKLSDICDLALVLPSLKTLILSDNLLHRVSGLPTSIRTLKINRNRLADIDGLVSLENLEYLDICNNSVSSFKEQLERLKVIHAENNKVISCSPFPIMHSLVELNLRSNRLKRLDFAGPKPRSDSLVTLDVSYNRIVCLESVEGLAQLKVLHLEHNEVEHIHLEHTLPNLKVLGLDFNRLTAFDGTCFPDLRSLSLDNNHISSFMFTDSCCKLNELSIRNQGGQAIKMALHSLTETRFVFLSGNLIKSMPTMSDFLALDYLEMCGVELEDLPHDFAQQVPNLTVLCLCHNYLVSIKPLRKLHHLQKLVLVNNRLENVNDLVKNLRLTELRYLDLRDNPVSYKYYPTTIPSTYSKKRRVCQCVAQVQDTDWIEMDIGYIQVLSLVWQQRRSTYRAVLIKSCSNLTILDGISVSSDEKALADHNIYQHYQEHSIDN
ncbi:hypothetical protein BC941DRAFT_512389 [Chlamydoabsidia padenii]|nr:hypothetical protein BC941DRAFT_512389 [Chlamydoabsidia padenii]